MGADALVGLVQAMMGLAGMYPITVLACIVITANHFLLDAVCGAAVLGVSHALAPWVPQLGRGTNPGRRPCLGGDEDTSADADCERPMARQYGAASAACERRVARAASGADSDTSTAPGRLGLDSISVQQA